MYATRHTLHDAHHLGWDNSLRPVLTVAPGSTIEFRCIDASGGQLDADSTARDVAALDFSRVNPVTGPVFIDGAEPGDALAVRIESFRPSGIGWTANIPGFGLLADRFTEEEWPMLPRGKRMQYAAMIAAPLVRPQFLAFDVNALPASAPLTLRHFFRLPLLTWTVRTAEQRATARAWADQIIFEDFDPDAPAS